MLGLPMPEVRIIDVPESLIVNSPELKIENGALTVPCVSGLQFGSRHVADPQHTPVFDYLPDTILHKVSNYQDFHRMLVFDKWTGNSDGRQAVFVKSRGTRSYRALFIDQGHCFNAGEWNFPDSPLRGAFARNSVYASVTDWKSFEPTLARVEKIEFADLWSIAREIPQEWYRHDISGLAGLMQALYDRCVLVRELITSFRKSSRNPFPNWT